MGDTIWVKVDERATGSGIARHKKTGLTSQSTLDQAFMPRETAGQICRQWGETIECEMQKRGPGFSPALRLTMYLYRIKSVPHP
jgi:hypothetical protein